MKFTPYAAIRRRLSQNSDDFLELQGGAIVGEYFAWEYASNMECISNSSGNYFMYFSKKTKSFKAKLSRFKLEFCQPKLYEDQLLIT